MTLNRRQLLLAAGAGLLGSTAAGHVLASAARGKTKKILFFTKSAGFQHSPIARKGDELGYAEKILAGLGKEHGYEIICSKDGKCFDPDKIGQWDAFAFYTTGDLTTEGTDKQPPMSQEGKKAFLDAIAAGKGFIGFHSSTDSFHSKGNEVDPYIRMIGAEFAGHGTPQDSNLVVSDPSFPGASGFPKEFKFKDEWYTQKNFSPDLHVVIYHNTEGMQGPLYQRPNFPEAWARMQDKGRVFYSSMGHFEDVWDNAKFQGLVLGALSWITGQVDTDVTPNFKKVTPDVKEMRA